MAGWRAATDPFFVYLYAVVACRCSPALAPFHVYAHLLPYSAFPCTLPAAPR